MGMRRLLSTFSSDEPQQFAQAALSCVDEALLPEHSERHGWRHIGHPAFLEGHRGFIAKPESVFVNQRLGKYIQLPKWSPSNSPIESRSKRWGDGGSRSEIVYYAIRKIVCYMLRAAMVSCVALSCNACGEVVNSGPDRMMSGVDGPSIDAPMNGTAGCNLRAPFSDPVALIGVSSPSFVEVVPRLSIDERTLYFHGHPVGGNQSDLYVAERPNRASSFGAPRLMSLSTAASNEFNPSVTANGLTIAYDTYPAGGGVARIYIATRTSTLVEFANPTIVTGLDTVPSYHDAQAHFSPDGKVFWFASNRGHWSDWDIYYGRVSDIGIIGVVEAPFNTTAHESVPVPNPDGSVLYFASTRAGGKGSNDLWVAYRDANGGFEQPIPVSELNSTYAENSGWLSPDGCRLYFDSDRNGSSDIFMAERRM